MSTSSYPLLYAAPCLAQRPRFHVHFTPTCASWITLVERWFAVLTESKLGAVCANWKSCIKQYLSITDETAKRATGSWMHFPRKERR
jgi:hypothetical protein